MHRFKTVALRTKEDINRIIVFGFLTPIPFIALLYVSSVYFQGGMWEFLKGVLSGCIGLGPIVSVGFLLNKRLLTGCDSEFFEVYDDKFICKQLCTAITSNRYDYCELYFDEIDRSYYRGRRIIDIFLKDDYVKSTIKNGREHLDRSFKMHLGRFEEDGYRFFMDNHGEKLKIRNA